MQIVLPAHAEYIGNGPARVSKIDTCQAEMSVLTQMVTETQNHIPLISINPLDFVSNFARPMHSLPLSDFGGLFHELLCVCRTASNLLLCLRPWLGRLLRTGKSRGQLNLLAAQ